MGERFTHNGVQYEELGNGKVRVIGAAPASPFTATPLPLSPEQQDAADRAKRDQDLQEQAARDQMAAAAQQRREWLATHNPDGSPKVAPREAPAGFQFKPDGTLAFIPGGPADPALKAENPAAKSDADKAALRAEAIDKIKLARSLIGRSKDGWFTTGVGSGVAGYFEGSPAYDLAQDTETLKNAGALTRIMEMAAQNGGKNPLTPLSNSDFQALASSLSNLDTGQSDTQYQANVQRVIDLYQRAYSAAGGTDLEGDIDPKRKLPVMIAKVAPGGPNSGPGGGGPGSVWDQTYTTPGGPSGAAPAGATTQAQPIDPAMQAELNAYIQKSGRNTDPAALRQFIVGLYGKYGATPGPNLDEYANATAAALRNGGQIDTNIPPETVPLSGIDAARNSLVNNPVGAFAANLGNAGGGGIPSLLAGEQMDALRRENPISSTLGEVAGGITGTMAAGRALRAAGASRFVSNPAIRSALANPFTADVAYGSAYGATQADDPVYGALGGAAAGAVGNVIGNRVGRVVPRILGRTPADPLSGGQRAVLSAVDRDGADPVLAALQQGQDLGLPMSLADVSPNVASLAGSAIRRSPSVAGQAREALGRRSQGQLDRLREGITRDLGPLDNVPQRADDLIAQARATAGPLYDEAYATTIPNTPEIESLLATPFGKQAISRSRTIAANERRSPTELGYSLDADGNAVLQPNVPMTLTNPGQAGGAPVTQQVYSTQSLDYAKRGMDDVLEQYRNPITGKLQLDEMGRSENSILRALLGEMDVQNPAYGQARAAYAGRAAEREALYQGRAAVTENPDLVAIQAGRQTPERLQMMQLGARDRLRQGAEALSNSTNPYRVLNTPAMEKRLAALYPENKPDVAQLLLQRDLESKMASTSNALVGNSATAERLAADQAFSDEGLLRPIIEGGVETAITGAPVMTLLRSGAGRRVADALRLGAGKRAVQKAEEIAPLALDTDTENAIAQILALQSQRQVHESAMEAMLAQAGARGARIGAGSGSAVTAALMRN